MALYPAARKRLIQAGSSDPPIIVIGAILHVDAGNADSLYRYFSSASRGIESHFHVPKTGPPEQYRDTAREADANLKANSFRRGGRRYGYVSIETQGYGAGEWTAHQLTEIKALLLWLSRTHRFPLRRCPAHASSGVGYHIMFGSPGPWTPVAKACPGPDRIKQFRDVLVPWMATAGTTGPQPPKPAPMEDEMTREEMAELKDHITAEVAKVAKQVWDEQIPDILTPTTGDTAAARTHLAHMPVRAAVATWATQIADVSTPESGDTAAAGTILTHVAPRVEAAVKQQFGAASKES